MIRKRGILPFVAVVVLCASPAQALLSGFLGSAANILFNIVLGVRQAAVCWNFYPLEGYPPRSEYDDVFFPPEATLDNIPPCSQADCPATMQGVFWLSYATEVMTFAPTNEGGDVGLPLAGTPPRKKMRLLSERVSSHPANTPGVAFSHRNACLLCLLLLVKQ